ncbi:MAG TPA: hypothetical protein VHM48_03700 [Candidatus Limnocylindrales bacterium]|nr:hypothetical protein [Candidatus Limnocylindrales bacterium]
MSKNPFSGLRLVVSAAAVVGMIAASAGPVAADTTPPGDTSYSQNGSSAELDASSCVSNGDDTVTCADQQIYVFTGKMTDSLSGVTHTSQLCVSLSNYTYSELTGDYVGTPTFEQGCRVDLPTGTIKIDSKLRSASLATTHLTVQDQACEKFGCDPGSARDIVVGASWTGFGPLMTSKSRGSSNDGTCRSNESFKGSTRAADVVGSLDGQALGGDQFGYISSGKYSFRSSCTEV